MTSLLWTYEQSDLYSCDTRTLHLVVMPAAVVGAFRFIVFKGTSKNSLPRRDRNEIHSDGKQS
jgi:hypothetical protein